MSSRVILNLDEELVARLDSEKERTGATRNSIVSRILERYFEERQAKQRLYDAWFTAEVERGIRSAEEEPLIEHEDALKRVRATISKARKQNAAQVV